MARWFLIALLLWPLAASGQLGQPGSFMRVATAPPTIGGLVVIDSAPSTATTVTSGTSVSVTFTVGSGSNRALLAPIMFSQSTLPSGVACTYDSVSMTELSSTLESDTNETATSVMYGLLAPISGSHTLSCSWTGSQEAHLAAISFTGVNQGSLAAAFPNGTGYHSPNGTTPGPISVTVTSATNHIVVGNFAQNCVAFSGVNGTIFGRDDVTGPNLGVIGSYNTGSASVTVTASFSGSCGQVASGVDVSY